MKVLIADELPAEGLADLREAGLTVDAQPSLTADQLPEAARGAAILVVRSTEVRAEVFEAAPHLSLVVRAGAGVNTIDVAAASKRGVYVANCPGQNALAVAELTLGLILSLDRSIPDNVAELRAGRWEKKRFAKARGLHGSRLGLVGTGSIAQAVGARARAFGMEVFAYSPNFTEGRALGLGWERSGTLHDLATRSDVLSVHVPASPSTKGLISAGVLSALADGSLFINTSRADVVDSEALLAEVRSGRLRAGLDVFPGEPRSGKAEFRSELGAEAGVYGTHHIGASTAQAQAAVASEAVRVIRRFVESGEVLNCVNVAKESPARWQLVVRHVDRVGVLANVLSALRDANINVQELENSLFEGGGAACAKIRLGSPPSEALLAEIRARQEEVIFADLVEARRA